MKILMTQLRRVGDVLMTTPAIRAIHEKFPDAEIHYLTEEPAFDILSNNPYISKVISVKQVKSYSSAIKIGFLLRKERYDIAIDFFSHYMSGVITLLTGAKKRIGFKLRYRSLFFTDLVEVPQDLKYSAYHKLALLKPLGIESENVQLDFFINDETRHLADKLLKSIGVNAKDMLIAINPCSRQPYKVWQPEKFACVADYLIQNYGAKVLFISGPKEEHFVHAVRSYMKEKALPDYPLVTLAVTRAIYERTTLWIGNDSGPGHIAISAHIPVILIFGRPKAVDWTPKNADNIYAFENDIPCKNECIFPQCKLECLSGISANEVIDKIGELLNAK